jgi:putative transposase
VFLASEAFVVHHGAGTKPRERLRELPRAQRRALAKPLAAFAEGYPLRREAMARAFLTGDRN